MARVSDTLTAETIRQPQGMYCFALVADGAGVTARSTSAYASQAAALSAAGRMAEGGAVDAEVVERGGGYALRLSGGSLEAVSEPYPDRAQAETTLAALTG